MTAPDGLPELRVLLVEAGAADVALVRWLLGRSRRATFRVEVEERLGAALQRLARERFDVVVADLELPDGPGLHVVRRLREPGADFPLVVLAQVADHDVAVEAVRLGAQDYVVKGEFDAAALERTLHYAIERHRLQARVLETALADELTGLYNRRGFQTVAAEELHRAVRRHLPMALLYFDIDDFTRINERFGHAEGDLALRTVAQVLRAVLRASDVVARFGGDEFLALVSEADEGVIALVRERLERELHARHLDDEGRPYRIHERVGGVIRPPDSRLTVEALLAEGDRAICAAKQARRAGQPAA
jgi:diguanylate cyclase (GGDEF)-like protein